MRIANEAESVITRSVTAPVVEEVDVLVTGGGAAGVVAAIAAARAGARTLLAERRGFLGGMMTGGNAGLTNFIVHQKSQAVQREIVSALADDRGSVQIVGGIPMEIAERLLASSGAVGTEGTAGSYVFTSQVAFKWLLMDLVEEAGAGLMLHCLACDAVLADGSMRGVVFETKEGPVAVLAGVVVDATGDGDIAAEAGCEAVVGVGPDDLAARHDPSQLGSMSAMGVMYRVGNVDLERCFHYLTAHPEHFSVQALALYSLEDAAARFRRGEMVTMVVRGREIGLQVYNSPDPGVVTLCCPCCKGRGLSWRDLTRAELSMRDVIRKQVADVRHLPGFEECWVIDCPEIGVRETRHVRGEYVLTIEDVLAGRDFPDSIGRGAHTVDSHGIPPEVKRRELPRNWSFQMPYRCLVPLGVDGLLVAGRCASLTHEAFGCARPTVQCMVTGEAASVAAAMCAARGVAPRALPPADLRDRLRTQGVVL